MNRIDAILDRVNPSDRVLDVGCVQHDADRADDSDWLHGRLVETGADVVGVDILETEVRRLCERGYVVICADAEALPYRDAFDIVVAGELIEHLANPGRFFAGARRALRSDGRLVVSTPNPWCFVHLRRAVTGSTRVNPEHTCWFDATTLSQLLARYGFEVNGLVYASPPAGVTAWLPGRLGGTQIIIEASVGSD